MRNTIVLCLGLLLIGACSGTGNYQHDLQESLLKVDREFSEASVQNGFKTAFLEYMAEDAVLFVKGYSPIRGKAEYREMAESGQPPGVSDTLEWEPFFADAAGSGDLGYTLGKYIHTRADDQGEESESSGYYCTIWKKQADKSWKFVFDVGIEGPGRD